MQDSCDINGKDDISLNEQNTGGKDEVIINEKVDKDNIEVHKVTEQKPKMKTLEAVLIILGILFISFNLRAPITAVGTIKSLLQGAFELSDPAIGLITTLPLVMFAIVSPAVAKTSKKIGNALTMMIGLLLILVGEFVRSYAGVVGLYLGTAIIGAGIAIGNVIIPAIIKLHFSHKVGVVTSIYTTGMCVFAAVGAGISPTLANGDMNLGWNGSLVAWFVLTLITIAIWTPQLFKKKKHSSSQLMTTPNEALSKTSIWKSPLAWWVTIFMGVQSLVFYSLVAWLSPIIEMKVADANFAKNMASLFQLMAIPATLVMPILTGKFKNQRGLVLVTCVIYIIGMLFFMFGANKPLLVIATILMSIGMGGSISLSIAFISLRSPNALKTSELSGMSQSAGYLIAAVGPLLIGVIMGTGKPWATYVVISIFIALIIFLAIAGMFAGTNKTCKE